MDSLALSNRTMTNRTMTNRTMIDRRAHNTRLVEPQLRRGTARCVLDDRPDRVTTAGLDGSQPGKHLVVVAAG